MKTTTRMEMWQIDKLIPYANNARTHSPEQIEKLRRSMREFGFVAPVLIDSAGNIIAGHGRILAAIAEGLTEAPCVLVEHLTAEQRQAYILADNRLSEDAGWDDAIIKTELVALQTEGFDVSITGFDPAGLSLGADSAPKHFWGDIETETSEEYDELVDKFRHKLTTDDCYTPPEVYDSVKKFVVDYYGLRGFRVIRPFYPGGDYQKEDYSGNCVVIDNPPFSILSEIINWYMDQQIRFFLFAPALTLYCLGAGRCNYIPIGADVVYENGVRVNTGFVTNLGEWKIDTTPDLYATLSDAKDALLKKEHKDKPVYSYPEYVMTSRDTKLAKYGQHYRVRAEDCAFIRALDAQKNTGKSIFGAGFLLSEKAAAEKAAAEKAAAEKAAAEKAAAEKAAAVAWDLSERELAIIKSLGDGADG